MTNTSHVADPHWLGLELTWSRSWLAWQTASGKSSGLHWFPPREARWFSSREEQQLKRRLRPGGCRWDPGQSMLSSLMENRNVKNQNLFCSIQINSEHHPWREFHFFNISFNTTETSEGIQSKNSWNYETQNYYGSISSVMINISGWIIFPL